MKVFKCLTGRQATLLHSSKISRQVLRLLDNPTAELTKISYEDMQQYRVEMDSFLEDVWLQIGDTEFNRSGLRNATDKLIEYLRIQ